MTMVFRDKLLLEHLEALDGQEIYEEAQVRFPVQTVIRPKHADEYHDFRGYAGKALRRRYICRG